MFFTFIGVGKVTGLFIKTKGKGEKKVGKSKSCERVRRLPRAGPP